MNRILFITGTDTDAGKTMASLLIMHALRDRDAVYLKPLQTGTQDANADSDAGFVHAHLPGGLPHGMPPAMAIHSLRPLPKAPLFAGDAVDFPAVTDFIATHAARHDLTVVEGAGGILVPITAETDMLDLALSVNAAILVIGRAGLGTINHSLLTIRTITTRGGNCLGTVLMNADNATTENDAMENALAIRELSGLPVFGIIDHVPDPRQPSSAQLDVMRSMLHRLDQSS